MTAGGDDDDETSGNGGEDGEGPGLKSSSCFNQSYKSYRLLCTGLAQALVMRSARDIVFGAYLLNIIAHVAMRCRVVAQPP